mgnify:CR=1 FL=1
MGSAFLREQQCARVFSRSSAHASRYPQKATRADARDVGSAPIGARQISAPACRAGNECRAPTRSYAVCSARQRSPANPDHRIAQHRRRTTPVRRPRGACFCSGPWAHAPDSEAHPSCRHLACDCLGCRDRERSCSCRHGGLGLTSGACALAVRRVRRDCSRRRHRGNAISARTARVSSASDGASRPVRRTLDLAFRDGGAACAAAVRGCPCCCGLGDWRCICGRTGTWRADRPWLGSVGVPATQRWTTPPDHRPCVRQPHSARTLPHRLSSLVAFLLLCRRSLSSSRGAPTSSARKEADHNLQGRYA